MQLSFSSPSLSSRWLQFATQWGQLIVLVRMHFYLLMRRRSVHLLLALLILGCIANIGIQYLLYSLVSHPTLNTSCATSSYATAHTKNEAIPCITMTKGQIQQQNIMRQDIISQTKVNLTFPTSIQIGGNTDEFLGALLLCLLASFFIGNDYQSGIIRLVFARGTPRSLFVLSQVSVLGLLALGFTLLLLLESGVAGLLIGPALGGHLQLPSWSGWRELFLYSFLLVWELWASALIVLLLTTLGRSATIGLIGICSYWALQIVVWPTLQNMLTPILPIAIHNVMRYISMLFIHTSVGALLAVMTTHPIGITNVEDSNLAPPLVGCILLMCYSIGCVLSTFLLLRKRDILA